MSELHKRRGLQAVAAAVSSGLLWMSACGVGNIVVATKSVSVPPANSHIYSLDATDNVVLEYQLANSTPSQIGTLSLPSSFSPTLIATDPAGNLYVGGTTGTAAAAAVLVYAAGALGSATPQRTVLLTSGKLTALAADASGEIYAGRLNALGSVEVYAANANGASTPAMVLDPTHFQYLNDIAVSSGGAISVSGWNGGAYFIDTYAPGANGQATPAATLIAPAGSYFGGIALDSYGNLWVLEQLTIVEFAPGATGTPTPLTSINLPAPTSPYTAVAYSNVLRIDANGLLDVPVTMTGTGQSASSVYVYAPSESGVATPAAIVALPAATLSTPLNNNIGLAVH